MCRDGLPSSTTCHAMKTWACHMIKCALSLRHSARPDQTMLRRTRIPRLLSQGPGLWTASSREQWDGRETWEGGGISRWLKHRILLAQAAVSLCICHFCSVTSSAVPTNVAPIASEGQAEHTGGARCSKGSHCWVIICWAAGNLPCGLNAFAHLQTSPWCTIHQPLHLSLIITIFHKGPERPLILKCRVNQLYISFSYQMGLGRERSLTWGKERKWKLHGNKLMPKWAPWQ